MWVGGVAKSATRGPEPVPAAAPEPGRKPAQPASDGSGPKPTTPPCPAPAAASARPPVRRTTTTTGAGRQITRNDHRSYQNLAEDQRSPLRRSRHVPALTCSQALRPPTTTSRRYPASAGPPPSPRRPVF